MYDHPGDRTVERRVGLVKEPRTGVAGRAGGVSIEVRTT